MFAKTNPFSTYPEFVAASRMSQSRTHFRGRRGETRLEVASTVEHTSTCLDFVAGGRGCGLIAARFLPPAGLNRTKAKALGHAGWRGLLLNAFDALVLWYPRVLLHRGSSPNADVTGSIRRSSGPAHLGECALPEVQYRRNATFPAQGDNCQKAPRRATPSWLK